LIDGYIELHQQQPQEIKKHQQQHDGQQVGGKQMQLHELDK